PRDETAGGPEGRVGADDDARGLRLDGADVERVGRADADAAALSDGEAAEPVVRTDPRTVPSDEIAGGTEVPRALADEVAVGRPLDEADLLALRLVRDGEAEPPRLGTDLVLRQLADGELGGGELLLAETEQEVRLIFVGIAPAQEQRAPAVVAQACVVSGGD